MQTQHISLIPISRPHMIRKKTEKQLMAASGRLLRHTSGTTSRLLPGNVPSTIVRKPLEMSYSLPSGHQMLIHGSPLAPVVRAPWVLLTA